MRVCRGQGGGAARSLHSRQSEAKRRQRGAKSRRHERLGTIRYTVPPMPIRPRIPADSPSRRVRPSAAPHPPLAAGRPGRSTPKQVRNREDVALRLAIGREGVGIELARSVTVGCLTVTELTATLPGIRFPVDVSGGVQRFRHRRGALETIHIEVSSRALERYAAPRLRGLVGTRSPEVWVGVRAAGASICVTQSVDADDDRTGGNLAPVLAFDMDVLADNGDSDLPRSARTGN